MEDKKIVVISWKDIDELVLKKNFVKAISKNYKIIILDISKILNFKLSKKNFFIKNNNVQIKYLRNLYTLKKILHEVKPKAVILYMMEKYSIKTMRIYNLVRSTGFKMIKILDTAFIANKNYFKNKIIQNFFSRKIKFDYIIEVGFKKIYHFYNSSKKIYSHHYDYESFLENRSQKLKKNDKKYALFLDENLIYHPDLILNKRKKLISETTYKDDLIKFFENYKKNFKLDVKVAAHPTSKINHFGKFKLYKKKTLQLVKNAEIVFVHSSTSLSFPVLYKKKIIFITSNEINRTMQKNNIYDRAKFFKRKPINISEEFDLKKIKKNTIYNSTRYNVFIDYFLKHPKSNKVKFSDKFFNMLNN